MELQEAMENTKNYKGWKVSINGMTKNRDKSSLEEFDKNYHLAREAWLIGDLKEVSDFFGIYI